MEEAELTVDRIPSGLSRCLLHAKSILVYCIDFQVVDDGEGSSPSSASLKIIIDDEDSVSLLSQITLLLLADAYVN